MWCQRYQLHEMQADRSRIRYLLVTISGEFDEAVPRSPYNIPDDIGLVFWIFLQFLHTLIWRSRGASSLSNRNLVNRIRILDWTARNAGDFRRQFPVMPCNPGKCF